MSSLIIQELALEFLHTCSRSTQDLYRNSEKHLEAEITDVQFNSKLENRNRGFSKGSDNPTTLGSDKHFKAPGLSDPTGIQVGFSLVVLLREHVFQGLKIPFAIGLSDAKELQVGLMVG